MPFNTALSGLQAAVKNLEINGNNIANVNTTGFKEARGQFADVYATSALGTTSTAIGTGVRLTAVAQQFTQGTISFTDNNLDLAISGGGFFILDENGSRSFTRAGEFGVDRLGFVTNATGQRLQGFLADSAGNITGAQGDLQINSANLSPNATSALSTTTNLNSSDTAPTTAWAGTTNFGGTPPAATSYNNTSSTTIFDSLGNSHILTSYFIKTPTANQWDVRFQVDGVDTTTNALKANSVDTNASSLVTSGTLSTWAAGDLTINGTSIGAGAADGVSTSDSSASAIALATAITAAAPAGITATVNPTTLSLGVYTPGATAGANFAINGVNIVNATPTQSALLAAINGAGAGVSATADNNNNIILTATGGVPNQGRNIQITTDGNAGTASFSNFSLVTPPGDDRVVRGTVTLTSTTPIIIAGNQPTNTGIAANTYLAPWRVVFNNDGTFNAGLSDSISLDWSPLDSNGVTNGSLSPQNFTVDLSNSTQFGSPFAVQAISQDGYTTGRLNQVDVDPSGIIFGRYTNGQSQALGQVVLAGFPNEQGLQPIGDTSWGETFASGAVVISPPGTGSLGLIQSGAREDSNVDLTEKLVSLITDQRNFQANAKTIETADATTQTIINMR